MMRGAKTPTAIRSASVWALLLTVGLVACQDAGSGDAGDTSFDNRPVGTLEDVLANRLALAAARRKAVSAVPSPCTSASRPEELPL